MKRVIAAVIMLIMVGFLCASGYLYTKKTTDKLIALTELAYNSAEEKGSEKPKKISREIKEKWEKDKKILVTITRHENSDKLDEYIDKLIFFGETNDMEKYRETCTEIKSVLCHIRDGERISVGNVM